MDELLSKQYHNRLNRLLHISEQKHHDNVLEENEIIWKIRGESWNKTPFSQKYNIIVMLDILH